MTARKEPGCGPILLILMASFVLAVVVEAMK